MTAQTIVERFTSAVEHGDAAALAQLYTDDVLYDAHVPNWRFQVQGRDAVVQLVDGWFGLPGRFRDLHVQRTTTGDVVVRMEWRHDEGSDQAVVVREMQLWRLDGDRIAEQVVYCSGRWDVPLVARMAEEAPLVRSVTAPAPEGDDADGQEESTRAAVERFDEAFGRRDIDAVMAAMTPDCVFEDTTPPDGTRHEGQIDVRRAWEKLFAGSPDAAFDREELLVAGDRAVLRWRYTWPHDGGGHVRGIDLFTVRDGKVATKRSYVKG